MGWRGVLLGLAVCACGGGGDPAGDADAGGQRDDASEPDAGPPPLSRLLFYADQDVDEVYELYLASFTDELLGVQKVNADVGGRWVRDFAWSATGDHVCYGVSEVGQSSIELWVVPVVGPTAGEPVRVALDLATSGETVVGSIHHVEWSPAGDRLAFLAQKTGGVSQLFVVEPGAEGTPTPLTAGDVADFAWSPDGSMLAYRVDTGDEEARGLFMVAASGGDAAEVSDLPALGDIAEPNWPFVGYGWSPDGRFIHYGADQDDDNTVDIYVSEVTGGMPSPAVRLSPPPADDGARAIEASWSPDSSRLLFLVDLNPSDGEPMPLYVVDLSRGAPGTRREISGSIAPARYARWSADSRWVAFHGTDDGPAELFVVDVANPSAEPQQVNPPLPPDGEVSSGSSSCVSTGWSPTSPQLSYRAIEEMGELHAVYVSDLSSGSPAEPVEMSGEAVDGGGVACPLRWTPDGRMLAYVGDQVTDGVIELFAVNADEPGAPSKVSGEMVFDGDVRDIMFQTLDFAWSPAGDWIVYRADQDVNERIDLYAVRRDRPGQSIRVSSLVALGDVIEHVWAP
jgi:Tol biopolymer transport system component